MKKIILFTISILVVMTACSSTKKVTKVSLEEAKNVNITLTKSECFGKCPAFTLSLSDGKITLNAISNMPQQGQFEIILTDDEIIEIGSLALNKGAFDNEKEEFYDQDVTDLPYAKMMLINVNKFKTINYRSFPPESIKEIDQKIMSIISDAKRYNPVAQ